MKAEGKGSEAGLATQRGFFGACASTRRFGRRTGVHGCVLCSSIVHIHRGRGSSQDTPTGLYISHAEAAPQHARYLGFLPTPGPNLAITDVAQRVVIVCLAQNARGWPRELGPNVRPVRLLWAIESLDAVLSGNWLYIASKASVVRPAERALDGTVRPLQAGVFLRVRDIARTHDGHW